MAGEDVGVLGALRALGSAGYEPFVAVARRGTYPSRSRAAAGTDIVPDLRRDVDAFAEAIAAVAARRRVRLVLPATDAALIELGRRSDALPGDVLLAADPPVVIERAMDKPLLSRLAAEEGLHAPPGAVLTAADAIRDAQLPAVVKPLRSELPAREGTLRRHSVSVVRDPLQLHQALSALPGGQGLVERHLEGASGGVAGVMWQGRLRAPVTIAARRTWPPDGGLFSYALTAPGDAEFERRLERLLRRIGFNGVFELDLVEHRGRRFVLDLNPRLFTSIALPVAAGVNLPAIWCDLLLGRDPEISRPRVGVRFRHEFNDARALLADGTIHAALGLLPHARTTHAVFSIGDPRPVATTLATARNRARAKARREPDRTLLALAPEWDELADRTGAAPFLRPGWLGAWWRAFGGGTLEFVTARRDGRLVGVLPLYRPRRRTAPYKAEPFPVSARRRTLRATANWHTPLHGPVAEDAEALEELAGTVVAARATLLSLGFLRDGGADAAPLRTAAISAGYRLHEARLPPVPYVAIEGDWPAYELGVSARLRRDLRRRRRKLETQGPVTVQVFDGTERLDRLLAEGFPLEASGWKAARGSAILSRSATRRFYTDVARWAAARGWLRLAFLRVGERPLAFQFGIEANGTYYFLKGGYDPADHAVAPAKLLLEAMLERAHELQLDRFDFVGGDEPWKLEWTNTCRERAVLHAFAPSAAGTVERLAVTVGRPARARVRASVRPAVAGGLRWLHRD